MVFSHRPQYANYSPKLTTRTLPRPLKNSVLALASGAFTTYLPYIKPPKFVSSRPGLHLHFPVYACGWNHVQWKVYMTKKSDGTGGRI